MATSRDYWNKTAERYAKSPVGDEKKYQRKLEETQSHFEPHMRILEFGCGTGTTAVHHAPHVAHIDAIDISENMLEIARGRAEAAGATNITFSRGTLHEFAAEDAAYDMVLGLNILHLVPNRQETIAEAARILKPGGRFVTSTVCLGASPLRFLKFVAPLAKLVGLMPDVFIFTEKAFAEEMKSAGFTIETQWHHAKDGIAVFMIARKS